MGGVEHIKNNSVIFGVFKSKTNTGDNLSAGSKNTQMGIACYNALM